MPKFNPTTPEMGCYFYTRAGLAAYVAYALESGSPLPIPRHGSPYAVAIGFIYGSHSPMRWDSAGGSLVFDGNDLVERITIETAFQYPKRRARPKVKPPEQLGRLL